MEYKTIESLNQGVSDSMVDILHEITKELNSELHSIIEENVYQAYKGHWYERGFRTHEFLTSFIVENFDRVSKGNITELTEEVMQDPTLMTIEDSFPYTHEDREMLGQIIESGEGYNFHTDAPPRPFWEEWIEWCMKEIPTKFRAKCSSRGLNIL